MKTYKKHILLGQLFFYFLSHTMQFTDLHDDVISKCIWYLEPSRNVTISNQDNNDAALPDEQRNALQYFFRNIMYFGLVNKKMNCIIKNFLSADDRSSFSFNQDMLTFHNKKELLLFYCPCQTNQKLYYCVVKLHNFFGQENHHGLDYKYDYALILSIHRYDTSGKHADVIAETLKTWIQKTPHHSFHHDDYLGYCIQYMKSEEITKKIKTWINIFTENTTKLMPASFSFSFHNANLYTLPRSVCTFNQPFTYDLFCTLVSLKYVEKTKL